MKLCRCLLVWCLYRRLPRHCFKGVSSFENEFSVLFDPQGFDETGIRLSQKILALPPGMCASFRQLTYPEGFKN